MFIFTISYSESAYYFYSNGIFFKAYLQLKTFKN